MQKDVIFSETGNTLVARIQCDVDHHSARHMRESIDAMLLKKKPDELVLDFSRVDFMDSSGLGLILGRVERATSIGAEVRLSGMSPRMLKLVKLSGIERIQGITVAK